MAGEKNKRNTEDTNSEIREAHFLVQDNKLGRSQEYKNTFGIR